MRQLRLSDDASDGIVKEMKSGDYDNLVRVFAKHFGRLVTLYKNGKEYIYDENDDDDDYIDGGKLPTIQEES